MSSKGVPIAVLHLLRQGGTLQSGTPNNNEGGGKIPPPMGVKEKKAKRVS